MQSPSCLVQVISQHHTEHEGGAGGGSAPEATSIYDSTRRPRHAAVHRDAIAFAIKTSPTTLRPFPRPLPEPESCRFQGGILCDPRARDNVKLFSQLGPNGFTSCSEASDSGKCTHASSPLCRLPPGTNKFESTIHADYR